MIELPDEAPRRQHDGATEIEFVGGPRDGQRDEVVEANPTLETQGAIYRRSVRCADDGALRYVYAGEAASGVDRPPSTAKRCRR